MSVNLENNLKGWKVKFQRLFVSDLWPAGFLPSSICFGSFFQLEWTSCFLLFMYLYISFKVWVDMFLLSSWSPDPIRSVNAWFLLLMLAHKNFMLWRTREFFAWTYHVVYISWILILNLLYILTSLIVKLFILLFSKLTENCSIFFICLTEFMYNHHFCIDLRKRN